MMWRCTDRLGVVTGTRLNLTEQEIVDMIRYFRCHPYKC